MADKLWYFFLRFVTIFPLLWRQSLENEKIWKKRCISERNHSSCISSLTLLRHRTCIKADLLAFEQWGFMQSSVLLDVFPVDQETQNYIRQVYGVVFSTVRPVPLKYKPHLVAVSSEALTEVLDLSTSVVGSEKFVEFVSGNKLLPNSVMLSHRYGGHQVGKKNLTGWYWLFLAVNQLEQLQNTGPLKSTKVFL